MCSLFSHIPETDYEFQTRSVRLGGHGTSVRLESAFWIILEQIANAQDVSLGRFLTKLHDEVLAFRGEPNNFASLLRCACLKYIGDVARDPSARFVLLAEARKDFALSD
jgi:predicted DNA-binding ribbon-helix-helix protein